jgi:osmoprotectant transport system permease protein
MNLIVDALNWIFGGNAVRGVEPIGTALLQHLGYTFVSIFIAALIAVPAGWAIGHTGKGRDVAVAISGAARAIPSFGLLIVLVLFLGVLHKPEAAVITFVLLAIPSLLAGAYTGLEAIDRSVVDAARAMGMTRWQVLWRVEVPLGLPLLLGGFRAATLQVVATVTIAAYANLGGLGQYIITGIPLRRFDVVLGGAILVALLALILDAIFALLIAFALPRGVRAAGRRSNVRPKSESGRTPKSERTREPAASASV